MGVVRNDKCCCTCEDWLEVLVENNTYDVHTGCDVPGVGMNLRGVTFSGRIGTNLLLFTETMGNDTLSHFVCCSTICYITNPPKTGPGLGIILTDEV